MIAQIQAELLKIRSTRTTLGLLLGMVGLVLLTVLLTGLLSAAGSLTDKQNQLGLLGDGGLAGIFAALAGILLVTSEYRFGTIRPTFLFTPRRARVITSKVVAGVLAGLAFGILGEGLGFCIGYAILNGRGIPIALGGGDVTLLLVGTLIGVALWGAIGVGLGAIVQNQIGAVITLLAWGFVAENLLFAFVPSVGRFAPVHAQNAMIGDTTSHLLSPAAGAAIFISWTALLGAAGFALNLRRDVT